jgi:hypothetical protein
VDLVEGLEPESVSAGFTDRVMHRVAACPQPREGAATTTPWSRLWSALVSFGHQLSDHPERHSAQNEPRRDVPGWLAGWAGGGAIVAKKALWAIAGLAVVVILVVVYFNGARTGNQGAEGTIGAAQRYRGAQPTSADVTAEQTAAHQFLQSDLFARMIRDKNVRSVLQDKEACDLINKALALAGADDQEAWAALGKMKVAVQEDKEVSAALTSKVARNAIHAMTEAAALKHGATKNALLDETLLADLREARNALQGATDEQWAAALKSKTQAIALAKAQQDPLAAVRRNHAFQVAMAEDKDAFMNLVAGRRFRDALEDSTFMNVLKSKNALKAIEADDFAALIMNHRNFMDAFDNAEFANLIHNARFMAVLGDEAFMEAFHSPGFKASLKNWAEIDNALKAKAQ